MSNDVSIAGLAVVTCATLASPALPPRLSATFTASAIACWRGASCPITSMCYFPRWESIVSMASCIPGSRIPLTKQTRFLVGRVLFGSASISITWFVINLLFEESRSTFRTIPKEPACSTGLGSKSFPSAFRTAGLWPASFLLSFMSQRNFVPPASSRLFFWECGGLPPLSHSPLAAGWASALYCKPRRVAVICCSAYY
jgi:hypothetical protein